MQIQIKGNKIFSPLRNKWLIATPEENVRQEYVLHLINFYEFSIKQMAEEVKVNNSKRGQGKAQADIVIWRSETDKHEGKSPVIVIECKAEHITLREEDFYQGYNYASWAGADFFVTTNLKNTKFFKVVKGRMPKKLEEIIEIPKAVDVNNDKKIKELLSKTKAFTRDEFSKLLFKCHNIIRNNDKLSPEAAFDEISKILFMKIRYEREQARTKTIFSRDEFIELKTAYEKITGKSNKPFYQHFFDKTKEIFKDDELFDPNDTIKIRETSFLQIVKELEKYNLSDTSDDIKGIAFEEFLGKTFRGELGQFFTPRTIVNYIVDILDPHEGEIICDPCCGSGGFLIKAFEYVREKIEKDIQENKERIKLQYYNEDFANMSSQEQEKVVEKVDDLFALLNHELNLKNPKSRLRTLSYDCIFGVDANPRMARTAKMNMIMHGDGHGGVHHHDGLLNINGIFDGRFDVILTNPPFGSRVSKNLRVTQIDLPSEEKIERYKKRYPNYEQKVIEPLKEWIAFSDSKSNGKPLLDLFDVGAMSGLTEVLFIERCLNLLKPGGRLGIVLPEGVLNNSQLQTTREYIEGKAKIINITSIPQDVFIASGATVKPSLVFLKKFTDAETKEYQAILKNATNTITNKYQPEIDAANQPYEDLLTEQKNINTKISELKKAKKTSKEQKEALLKVVADKKLRLAEIKLEIKPTKKSRDSKLKELDTKIEKEIKVKVKEDFDYPIPVVEVEKAGITSTGAECENELLEVAEEFQKYRKTAKLWEVYNQKFDYPITNKKLYRTREIAGMMVSEPEVFYGK